MAAQLVDIADVEDYLLDDDESSYDSDDSSHYSSDEEYVACEPILDAFQEKLIVTDLKQKARARRLRRKAAKKVASDLKEAEQCDEDTTATEEATESEVSHVADLPDDDSIHAHMKRSGSGLNLELLSGHIEVEDDGGFHDFEDDDEVELEMPLEI